MNLRRTFRQLLLGSNPSSRRTSRRFRFESLERRTLMAADLVATEEVKEEPVEWAETTAEFKETEAVAFRALTDDYSDAQMVDGTAWSNDETLGTDDVNVMFYSMVGSEDEGGLKFEATSAETDEQLFETTNVKDLETYVAEDGSVVPLEYVQRTLEDDSQEVEIQTLGIPGVQVWTWYNSALPQDVNGDSNVTPIDVLFVINALNRFGFVSTSELGSVLAASASGEGSDDQGHLDVNGDSFVTPLDALLLVNFFNGDPNSSADESQFAAPMAARLMDPSLSDEDDSVEDALLDAKWADEARLVDSALSELVECDVVPTLDDASHESIAAKDSENESLEDCDTDLTEDSTIKAAV